MAQQPLKRLKSHTWDPRLKAPGAMYKVRVDKDE